MGEAVEEIVVVMAGAAKEVVTMTNLSMVCILVIQIYYLSKNNGKICPVGKCVSCNRAMTGNAPLMIVS